MTLGAHKGRTKVPWLPDSLFGQPIQKEKANELHRRQKSNGRKSRWCVGLLVVHSALSGATISHYCSSDTPRCMRFCEIEVEICCEIDAPSSVYQRALLIARRSWLIFNTFSLQFCWHLSELCSVAYIPHTCSTPTSILCIGIVSGLSVPDLGAATRKRKAYFRK